ncbi:MAG: CaiB/BaiF CoA-transferase family protein [Pseudomonadota bacterium]
MGPLQGIKVVEIRGIGPGPYAGMLLADMGADVIVVDRTSGPPTLGIPASADINCRNKRSIALNLKAPAGLDVLLRLVGRSDVLFEGFRPGVAERLGFGPDACRAINKRLVYGRLTGWGQAGPLAQAAGHDINYISITGALAAIGAATKPTLPLNLVGDYAGGSLFLVVGILAALLNAKQTGEGQVVDAAITDGSASLMSVFHGLHNAGFWRTDRQANLLDGAAYYYDVYETSDGKFISVGALEPQFYAELVERAGLDEDVFGHQAGPEDWPRLKQALSRVFKTKSQQQWCDLLEGSDACVAPVFDFVEAPAHPHNIARNTYINIAGVNQPAPAPRFSRTVCADPVPPHREGADTDAILTELGFDEAGIAAMRSSGVLT